MRALEPDPRPDFEPSYSMEFLRVDVGRAEDGHLPVGISTSRGKLQMRYYPALAPRWGVVFAGGVGTGWNSPLGGKLYPEVCKDLPRQGVAAAWVRYRKPGHLAESILDVLAGIHYLGTHGVEEIALVGHSFGGAVAIQVGAGVEAVRSVVALSTQPQHAEPAADLGPRCSLLMMHGEKDIVFTPESARKVYQTARQPKRLEIIKGAGHQLEGAGGYVRGSVTAWLVRELTRMDIPA